MLTSCYTSGQSNHNPATQEARTLLSEDVELSALSSGAPYFDSADKEAYVVAYTDFLLHHNLGFPICEYYLFDLDFDGIPELGVLHGPIGSMGGYFTFYRFDGEIIIPILNNENSQARVSDHTQLLADIENKKLYFLTETNQLLGPVNGTYGYVRELVIQDGIPVVYNILDLKVYSQGSSIGSYEHEDDYLANAQLNEFITRYYSNGEWKDISPLEYIRLKREIIPIANTFVDLRGTDAYHLMMRFTTLEKIDALFSKWNRQNIIV